MDLVLEKVQEVSFLTNSEYIELNSTFIVIFNVQFQCNKCTLRINEQVRNSKMGCQVETPHDVFQFRKQYYYKRCPANFWNAGAQELISMYRHFQKGLLPYEGGLMDQPSKFIEAMELVESLHLEDQQKRNEQAMAKMKRKPNGR